MNYTQEVNELDNDLVHLTNVAIQKTSARRPPLEPAPSFCSRYPPPPLA